MILNFDKSIGPITLSIFSSVYIFDCSCIFPDNSISANKEVYLLNISYFKDISNISFSGIELFNK